MNSVYKLLIQILGKDSASPALKQVTKGIQNTEQAASGLSKTMQTLAAVGFSYAAKQAVQMAWDFGVAGAEALRLEDAFQDLAGTASNDLLRAIKEATGGTVSEMDAMAAANRGILLGMGSDIEQWSQLTEVARFRARAMGIDTTQALSDIATGIGRESRLVLDNLGIILDMDKVMQDYAKTLGTTADALTATERKQAIMTAVIADGQQMIAEAGGVNDDYKDSIDRMTVAFDELIVKAQKDFAPAIAGVADAVTETLPKLEATVFQVWTLVQAMDASMRASYRGADGQAAFENSILSSIGAVREQNNLIDGWMVKLDALPDAMRQTDSALETHTRKVYNAATAYMALSEETRKWKGELMLADITAMDPYEMLEGRLAAEEAIDQQREDNERREEERAERNKRAWEDAISAQKQAYQDLRSTVESALQPTSVTALDMGLADIGQYVDKWDENARRLDAIAARGFAELQQHADWAAVLKIPPNVLAAGEEALKSWAAQTSQDVRNLFRPDLLNIDDAVAAVEHYMQQQAAKELSLDLITQAVIDKGIVGGEAAKKKVAAALGLDQTYIGEQAGDQLVAGLMISLKSKSLSAEFAGYMQKDVSDSSQDLRGTGESLWLAVELGILAAMAETNYALEFATVLAPLVAQILKDMQERTGG